MLDPALRARLRSRLRAWYRKRKRTLPWRDTGDPYRVLVSEFMLQQTRVATVLPYFDRFLERFPDLATLAAADEESVRAAWSGLGYYRRARNLQASARALLAGHDGELPADLDALRALPGVGDYTAAALGSIVHDLPAAVVDGNVVRVITRLLDERRPVEETAVRNRVRETADDLVPDRGAGDWNQAMMELGATVCHPRSPDCPACPWNEDCAARAAGDPEAVPVKRSAAPGRPVTLAAAVVRRGDRVLLLRRSDASLLDGTWELPQVEVPRGTDPRDALAAHLRDLLGRPAEIGSELAVVRHSITTRRITLRAHEARVEPAPRASRDRRAWVDPDDLADYPVSSLTPKTLAAVSRTDRRRRVAPKR